MKKLVTLVVSGVSAIVLSACGGGGGTSDTVIFSVNILDLGTGYMISGVNDNNDIVELEFCGNRYNEYINYYFMLDGTFTVDDVYVDFSNGVSSGDYIDTYPTDYNFVVGDIYNIYDNNDMYNPIDSLEVTSIELITCQ